MNILDQIDEFLNNQKESEAKLFFFLPILLFGFLSYYFLYPITDEDLNNALNTNKKLHSDINKLNAKINNLNRGNLGLKRNIVIEKKELKQLTQNKIKYDELVKNLKFLKFNLVEWAKFYNNIPVLARKHHIYIYKLDNIMYDVTKIKLKNKLIQKKMTITISANGDFINFIKFMIEFEKLKKFVKITAINMTANDLKLTIDIYGTKL